MMRNHHIIIFCRYLVSTAICLFYLTGFLPVQAQTPEKQVIQNVVNPDQYTETITTVEGETVTRISETYVVKVIDGKKIRIRIKSSKVVMDDKNQQVTGKDTTFASDGVTPIKITEHRFSSGHWIYTETKEFDNTGFVTNGEKYEVGFDGVARQYLFDKNTGGFTATPTPVSNDKLNDLIENRMNEGYGGYDKEDINPSILESTRCQTKTIQLFGGYASLKRDIGGENKENYQGGEASFLYNFYSDPLDSMGHPVYRKQVGVDLGVILVTVQQDDAKYKLSAIVAGPEFTIQRNQFSGAVFIRAGVLTDGFKFGDVKENETTFTINPGTHIEYTFRKSNVGIAVRPQFLMTKLDDQSQWNFLLSAGLTLNLGCAGNK